MQRLTRRIAELEHFKPETAIAVLEEYHQLTLTQRLSGRRAGRITRRSCW